MNGLIKVSLAAAFLAACAAEEPTVQQSPLLEGASQPAEVMSEQKSGSAVAASEPVEQAAAVPTDVPDAIQPLQVGLSAAADYSLVYPTSILPAATRRVTIVFRFDEESRHERLTGTLVAVDVGDAAPAGSKVGSTTIAVRGSDRGALDYTLPRPFPPGTYRLDVTTDKELWNSVEFQVAPAPGAEIPSPAELMPLAPGRTWTYDFNQRAGAGARMNVPEKLVGADGVFRATTTLSIRAMEEAGGLVELRRQGELQTEEWWRADKTGIVSTQSREDGQLTILDPPRPVFPVPANLPREWQYAARDGSFKLQYRMWGPMPVRGPSGDAPGYIIFIKHDGPVVTTAERHFIPGVGMTREVIILGVRGKMMSRQEMVLRKVEPSGGATGSGGPAR
ncbi:MAG TPA: hypothetical protein VMS56_14490 [Thermoanaerobaculia bacterium]|nr:hypothetical protein [Thermoanaerobaculia bacterium]